jgi:glycosyltransferase involved in cell wall biosynthesis
VTVTNRRPVVLVLLGAYWPGNDSTGPNQSFVALCRALANEFAFYVVARDRPVGSGPAIAPSGRWIDLGFVKARYCPVARHGAEGLGDILRSMPYDVLMMNGFFDREFTTPALLMRYVGRAPQKPAILSTRGEFASGALSLKSGRKRAYLAIARALGLHSDVWLQASGPREAEDIRQVYPFTRGVLVAPNVRDLGAALAPRAAGAPLLPLRIVFLGRIARVKNLDIALRVLCSVKSPVLFDIFGPIAEPDHWDECRRIIAKLPANVSVAHKGEIANAAVPETLAGYDLFFLPTRGENFGHAIMDALTAGVPALISDRTPFKDLEGEGAGWSLPLDALGRFAEAVEAMAAMSEEERGRMRLAARRLAERIIVENDAVTANREMIANLLATTMTR